MSLFKSKRKKQLQAETARLEQAVRVEIEHSGAVSQRVANKTKRVTKEFNDVIKQNGFTMHIFVAAGGHDHTGGEDK